MYIYIVTNLLVLFTMELYYTQKFNTQSLITIGNQELCIEFLSEIKFHRE
jgi:hypothetical protein